MRIIVMGAGAIGSLFGGLLAAEHEVVLVGRRPHVEAIKAQGLRISGESRSRVRDLRAVTSTENLVPADVLMLTVKAYDTTAALAQAGEAIGPDTFVLSLQNGLGNVEAVAGKVGNARAIGGVTSHGCLHRGPGHVEHTGIGDTVIGPLSPPDLPAHHELAEALTSAGLETRVVRDVRPELWAKVAVNAAINPVTAIAGLPNGALHDLPELGRLASSLAAEVEEVATALGMDVEEGAWVDKAMQVAERTAKNRSSMLQDVERGKPTEIDAICGQVAARAQEAGLEADLNRALHALVKGIEATLRYDPR